MNKHLEVILREMCKRVGADFSVINSSENWFQKYTWTQEQQNDFKKWLVDYLQKHNEARQEFGILFSSKKRLEWITDMFLFDYGWKLKDATKKP